MGAIVKRYCALTVDGSSGLGRVGRELLPLRVL